MTRKLTRHGGLTLAILMASPALWAQPQPVEPVPIRSRVFDIEYAINEEALPLSDVTLWYTLDEGATWWEAGRDDDRQSPLTFQTPTEGLHGFYLMIANAAGASGDPPTSKTTPHQWVFVDATPPVVELHPLREANSPGGRVVQIRWSATDTNFDARPIELVYQRPPDETWQPISPDRLANTGRYDWRLPDDLLGAVGIRLIATDRGGHRVESNRQVIEIRPTPMVEEVEDGDKHPTIAPPNHQVHLAADVNTLSGSARAKEQAGLLFKEAMGYRDRGQYREAAARLRQAAKLDPLRTDAFVEMGNLLYRLGDRDRALGAYQLALRQEPNLRQALRGSAMIHSGRKDHAEAARLLRTILRYNPNDVEEWMNLGDVAIYQGDEVLARECYTRASRLDPTTHQIAAEARQRLAVMEKASGMISPDAP